MFLMIQELRVLLFTMLQEEVILIPLPQWSMTVKVPTVEQYLVALLPRVDCCTL